VLRTSWPQARRQYLAAGGPKTRRRGQKPEGGPHLKNTVLDVYSNQGAKREMGGRARLATPLAAVLLGHDWDNVEG